MCMNVPKEKYLHNIGCSNLSFVKSLLNIVHSALLNVVVVVVGTLKKLHDQTGGWPGAFLCVYI